MDRLGKSYVQGIMDGQALGDVEEWEDGDGRFLV